VGSLRIDSVPSGTSFEKPKKSFTRSTILPQQTEKQSGFHVVSTFQDSKKIVVSIDSIEDDRN
jgi:hypothetical protein